MYNAALSQRVAKACQFPPLAELSMSDRFALADRVHDADSFESLPVPDRAAIAASEGTAKTFSEEWESPYDLSSVLDDEDDHAAGVLMEFADYMGYTIDENPGSKTGYTVTSPSGKALGGFIAAGIIRGWQNNPSGKSTKAAAKKAGAKGGAGGKAAAAKKSPEEIAAAKAQLAAEKLDAAKANAARTIALISPDILEAKSKGKISGDAIQKMIDQAQAEMNGATDPKAIQKVMQKMKDNIALYKAEATKPPPTSETLSKAVAAIKNNLPSAQVLAGTSFDEMKIQKVIDAGSKAIDSAKTPAEAQAAVKKMRQDIALEKIAQTKAKAEEAAARKAATAKPKKQPKTANEWADFYTDAWFEDDEPQQFMAAGQPRAGDGKWSGSGGGGGSAQIVGANKAQEAVINAAVAHVPKSVLAPVGKITVQEIGYDGAKYGQGGIRVSPSTLGKYKSQATDVIVHEIGHHYQNKLEQHPKRDDVMKELQMAKIHYGPMPRNPGTSQSMHDNKVRGETFAEAFMMKAVHGKSYGPLSDAMFKSIGLE